jgi:hypothetical protein
MSQPGVGPVAFPELASPFVDENRFLGLEWLRFLIALWQLAGGSQVPIFQAVFLRQLSPGEIGVYDVSVGGFVGLIRLKDFPGAPEVPQTLTTSPFLFTAPGDGFLTAFGCKIEITRTGGYYPVSLTGGSVPLMRNDGVRLSWTSGTPTAVWFPDG